MDKDLKTASGRSQKYLSPLGAWALAFGCSVGWGSFVMPGNTFLPIAGPVGTAIGMAIGAAVIMVIGLCYHYMMNVYPDCGGAFTYTKKTLGYDHGFLSAWFLLLTYVAVIWANATALPLIARNLFGSTFQFGFTYQLAGFHIYMGEILLAAGSIALAALLCLRRSLAVSVQIIMAVILFAGVAVCFGSAAAGTDLSSAFVPAYAPGRSPSLEVFNIVALAPWAFVGFESISHSACEFRFSHKKTWVILLTAVAAGGFVYIALALLAVTALPTGFSDWTVYIGNLSWLNGEESLPTLFASARFLDGAGRMLFGLAALGGIITGLVGNFIAASRLVYSMGEDGMFPSWFGRLNKDCAPSNAILFIAAVSLVIPFFGRTAISWIVDVTTVGAAIAYAYTSAAAYKTAKEQGNNTYKAVSLAGLVISLIFVLFFLIPNILAVSTLSTESYLILAAWSLLGFVVFRSVFKKDKDRRLGRSTIVWTVLLGLIILTSTVWVRQASAAAAEKAVAPIHAHYMSKLAESGVDTTSSATMASSDYLQNILQEMNRSFTENILIQIGLIVLTLVIVFNIYSILQERERQAEVERALAEESSKAKTSFLSNMSHEIRTPMNAIIGLDNIALKEPDLSPRTRDQLEKIGASARHLLVLINDILDMSRIESGRMVLKNEEFLFKEILDQISVMINGQCEEKGLNYECHVIGRPDDYFIGDGLKLKQVIINILGNAVKFTDAPGSVILTVEQTARKDGVSTLRFVMKDTGIGMDKEFIPRLFEAFSQEDATTTNRYGGSGLGMAITKNLVEMMNGNIKVDSEKGKGSTFTVTVGLGTSDRSVTADKNIKLLGSLRVLVVDDDEVACEHACLVLSDLGIEAEKCVRSTDAYTMIKNCWDEGSPYQLVITDYKMPVINGIDLTREIRRFDGGKTAVIILTGYDFDSQAAEARQAGVDGILAKPLFADSLLREIQYVMQERDSLAGSVEISGQEEESAVKDLSGLRMLIAEDVELNAEILTDLLEMEDIESEWAQNGQIAVEMFEKSGPGYYDAVLMDVRMPVMDGLAATRAIRSLDRPDAKTIPIIAMTANAFDDDVQRSHMAGMNAHLSKPVDQELLMATLARLC